MLSLTPTATKKAVAYYRHSAEDKQENSVPIQRDHAQKFAEQYRIEIIHEEADEGKSGLLSNRPGFERLFNEWVLSPEAPHFDYVLVYDVSRWGRFQDQDEAAYYEFRCKQNGKKVIYISRGFPKEEQQLISHLQTSIERYMAAEYSRQLSEKVFYGCVKVTEQGYSAGGTACYGMSRQLLDSDKKPIRLLKRGEHKQIANERVTFVPSNDETTEAVRDMYSLLVKNWKTPTEIAEAMNERGIPSANGSEWNAEKVIRILTNETYTGTLIYNKTWGRLKQKSRRNPRNEWVIHPDAFPAIVDRELFRSAQEHLYWLIRSKWKRGQYTTNKVRKFIQKETRELFIRKGLSRENANLLLQNLPIVFGVSFYKDTVPHWCFFINEPTRNYGSVLAIGIAIDQRDPIDILFSIPIDDFTIANIIIFGESDDCYSRYKLERSKTEEIIVSLADLKLHTDQQTLPYGI